jgi:hypothetical protein
MEFYLLSIPIAKRFAGAGSVMGIAPKFDPLAAVHSDVRPPHVGQFS